MNTTMKKAQNRLNIIAQNIKKIETVPKQAKKKN